MQGKTVGLLFECFGAFILEMAITDVRPNSHRPVATASRYKVLLDADVKAINRFRVERRDKILVLLLLVWSLKVDWHFDDLV